MSAENRALTRFDLTCIGINSVVGSSIFMFPAALAGFLGPASIAAFAAVGLLMFSVGLCFAEAATHFDEAGGSYLYAREAFGDRVGFAIGWLSWFSYLFGWAAVSNGIASYLSWFDESLASPWFVKSVAGVTILSFGVLNYRGVKLGAWVSNFFTAAKLAALLVFVAVGLPKLQGGLLTPLAPKAWSGFGPACFLAYFAFQGFEGIPVPSGEAATPRKHVPFAVVTSLIVASVVYMLVQLVAVGTNPGLAEAKRPLADTAFLIMGPMGAGFIALAAAASMTGYTSSAALVCPRFLSALAHDGHVPAALGASHPRFATPYLSILVTTGIVLSAALVFDFGRLVDFSNIAVCAQYITTCAAVPVLRRRMKAEPGSFRLPGGLLVPVIGVLATLWLGAQGGASEILWSAAILAAGFVIRALCRL
ncbi:MAG: amino acid permease [Elusimicrobia bacterium]|nr:amino acid permease [Elusimicrobiota bacterium]